MAFLQEERAALESLLQQAASVPAQMPGWAQTTPARNPMGYLLGNAELDGRALLGPSQRGAELVMRLKDTRPLLTGEIQFWAGLLAELVEGDIDLVSAPPSSGKVPACEHLATLLAGYVAWTLNKPYRACFVNDHPRGHRGSRVGKLQEQEDNPFTYTGPGNGMRVLVVEDVVFTRGTAIRCVAAARAAGDSVTFAVLYRG